MNAPPYTEQCGFLSEQHRFARYWVSKGLPIFPCLPGAKEPAVTGGYKAATTDLGQIDRWWEINPKYNPATCPEDSGFCVIDVDDKPGKFGSDSLTLLEMLHGDLPPTRTTSTPSGGRHLWFKGSLPSTVGKLGKDIDTRGIGGYVLLPGSEIDGVPYTLNDAPMATIPEWVKEATFKKKIKERAVTDEEDAPHNIKRARAHLEGLVDRGDMAIENQGGNDKTYQVLAVLHDMGLSDGVCASLFNEVYNPHCEPPWEEDELDTLIEHVWAYSQNEIGSKGITNPLKTFENIVIPSLKPNKPKKLPKFHARDEGEQDNRLERLIKRFRGSDPVKDAQRPELEFWDDNKTILKSPDGCSILVYGKSGCHKTTYVLQEIIRATKRGAKVVFSAGEGGYGIGKMRVPTICDYLDIELNDLRGKYETVHAVPNLTSDTEVEAFIKARTFKPDVIVIDTLARATPGVDENAAATASAVIERVDCIRREFKCVVIVIHHTGKNASNGPRGSSGFEANFDVVLEIVAYKTTGTVVCRVRKMKDGPDGHEIYNRIMIQENQAPVLEPITRQEYLALSTSETSTYRDEVVEVLRRLQTETGKSVSTHVLATELVSKKKEQSMEKIMRAVASEEKKLQRHVQKMGQLGPLAAYVEADRHGDPIKPYNWTIPQLSDWEEDKNDF